MDRADFRMDGISRITGAFVGALALLALFSSPPLAHAQGALSGFKTDPDEPIEVEADALEVEDQKSTATFIGNVRVVQGDIRMKSDRLTVHYAQRGTTTTNSRIQKIHASGNVIITAPDQQTASGNWADYKVASREIEMGNSVVLTQGENVIRGSRLHVDMNSGKARVSSGDSGGKGRVKGLFQPGNQ